MIYSTLLFEQSDGIARVTINRPDKLNALNHDVIRELGEVITRVTDDPAIRAVLLTGAGPKAFIAGADISELAEVDAEQGYRLARLGQESFRRLELCGKPVLAAVNGFALGGGCELAMACHIRFASPNARFGQPEVKLGLIPGYGGTVRLPRLVGRGRALELLLSGNMIDAEEAARIGLVNRVVATEELIPASEAMLRTILAQGPLAVRACLETVDRVLEMGIDPGLEYEAERFAECCGSEDKSEGTSAFLAKRAPAFQGR